MKSTVDVINYFGDEETDKLMMDKVLHNPYYYNEHEVGFSLSQYMEAIIVHILGFGILGPFVNIYTLFTKKNKYLMSNMHFGRFSFTAGFQYLYWIIALLQYYLFFFTDSISIDYNTMYILFISIIMRSSVIAGKYSTFQPNYMRMVRETKLQDSEIRRELMMVRWFGQGDEVVLEEIHHSLVRKEIDDEIFKIAFMGKMGENTTQELKEIYLSHKEEYCKNKFEERKAGRKVIHYFDSKVVFEFLVKKFNKTKLKRLKTQLFILIFILMIVYGFGAGFVRLIFNQTFHGESTLPIISFYENFIANVLLVLTTYLFFGVGKMDMMRRSFILRQMGQMISPKKLEDYTDPKYLPTVNILDQLTLNSWLELRKLTIDYGKKYFYRHQVFMPVIFFLGLLNLIIALGFVFFNLTDNEKTKIEIAKLQIFMVVCFILSYYMLFDLLYKAAAINKEFNSHIEILKSNKQLYKDLLFFKEFYFSAGMKENKEVYSYDAVQLRGRKSSSYVHLKLAREISEILGDALEENIKEYLENLIMVNDACVEELEDEEKFNSLRVLGFEVNDGTVTNLIVVFLSITVTAYEILYPG